MMDNWTTVLQAIESTGAKLKNRNGVWRGNSPLRTGSDSNAFTIKVDVDGMDGVFKDHVSGDSGNFYQLASLLGVQLEDKNPIQVESTRREYSNLEDYAQAHGVSGEVFAKARWECVTQYGRPALKFPTATGNRYRFLDGIATGDKPLYMHDKGTTTCFYGLNKAIAMADNGEYGSLVFCNGEASTVVAQHYGIPAFCQTSGEKPIQDNLLKELKDAWQGRIIIALDCDKTGRDVSVQINKQIPNSVIVDLGLSKGGDLADLCKLHEQTTYQALLDLVARQPKQDAPPTAKTESQAEAVSIHTTVVNRDDMVRVQLSDRLHGKTPTKERGFAFPIETMHKFGGFMETCLTGKLTAIIGGSGDGKTQFLETCIDMLNAKGVNGLFYGIEWSKEEMEMRRIQRWSGRGEKLHITYSMLQKHSMYLGDKDDGIPDMYNSGTRLTDEQLGEYDRITAMLNKWRGHIEYHEGNQSLEATLDDMRVAIERSRNDGLLIRFIVFDYAQLLKAKSWDNSTNRYEFAVELVKDFAIEQNVHVFMTSQVNKGASADSKQGTTLSADSANFIRKDKFNLVLILDRQYYKKDGEYIETNAYYLTVGKASMGGKPEGYTDKDMRVPLVMLPNRLYFSPDSDWRVINASPYNLLSDNQYCVNFDKSLDF